MSITLRRLSESHFLPPGPGTVKLAVARHEAEAHPSAEVAQVAQARARLIHRLPADVAGVEILDHGETDAPAAREVVEVVLSIAEAAIPALATVLAAWITTRRSRDATDSVPGWRLILPDGSELSLTNRQEQQDRQPAVIVEFLDGRVREPSA